jgi:hypothetical protein
VQSDWCVAGAGSVRSHAAARAMCGQARALDSTLLLSATPVRADRAPARRARGPSDERCAAHAERVAMPLGDNVYLTACAVRPRRTRKKRVWTQPQSRRAPSAAGVPGNHDWDNGGGDGWKRSAPTASRRAARLKCPMAVWAGVGASARASGLPRHAMVAAMGPRRGRRPPAPRREGSRARFGAGRRGRHTRSSSRTIRWAAGPTRRASAGRSTFRSAKDRLL